MRSGAWVVSDRVILGRFGKIAKWIFQDSYVGPSIVSWTNLCHSYEELLQFDTCVEPALEFLIVYFFRDTFFCILER